MTYPTLDAHDINELQRANPSGGIANLLWELLDHWKWVAAATATGIVIAASYALTTTPIYRTSALVQIKERQGGVQGIEEVASSNSAQMLVAAEFEIVRSRAVLQRAVESENLYIRSEPRYFPLIGGAIARSNPTNDARLGLESFAWGGERLTIDQLDVMQPLEGEQLTLVAQESGRFSLYDPDDVELLSGTVGDLAEGSGVTLLVREMDARPGTRFTVVRENVLTAMDQLRKQLTVTERGEQTGVLELALEGPDPAKITATLQAITDGYVQQSVDRFSADADNALGFVNEQLPQLRAQAETAQEALTRFRVGKGTVDMSLETQSILQQQAEIEQQISTLALERAERSRLFTPQHPNMIALDEQERELEQKRSALGAEIRELPVAEQDVVNLTRNVHLANELYTVLLNRAQELQVLGARAEGNVRVIDTAFQPIEPSKPRKALVLALGLVLGFTLSTSAVWVRKILDTAIHDPKDLEEHFALPICAIIPRYQSGNDPAAQASILALREPHDPAVESLRSLRTSIIFSMQRARNHIICISGAAPGVGKSFVTANLGVLLAQAGRTVLVVDGDLRRGRLHTRFGIQRQPGLSEAIAGDKSIDEVVQNVQRRLYVLTCGQVPTNPAELPLKRGFTILMAELAKRYDVVLLDSPPVLATSEAAVFASLAGINLLTVRSGRQTRREVELALDRLLQGGAKPTGFIFNDLPTDKRRYAHAGYRSYRYESERAPADGQ